MSSCSFLTDGEDSVKETTDKMEQQQKALEEDHLKEVNAQLTKSIEGLKAQLKEAITASESIKGMTEQINTLKSQLAESKESEKNLAREIQRLTSDGETAAAKAHEEIEAARRDKEAVEAKLKQESDKLSKMRKERNALKDEIEEKNTEIESCALELRDCKNSKKKLKNKFIALAEKLQQSEEEIAALNLQVQNAENAKASLAQDNEALKVQLSSAQSINAEHDTTVQQLKKLLDAKVNLINQFEEQFESQRVELEEANQERQHILELVAKLHQGLTAAETKVEELTKENDNLNNKARLVRVKKNATTCDIAHLSLPFAGEMGDRVNNIMNLPQYQPLQRIQLVINEVAKKFADIEQQLAEKTEEAEHLHNQLDAAVNGQTPYCQILDSLLRELKNIACQEQQINTANVCRVDTTFIEFMAQKSAELEPLIRDELLKDPRFIPSDFFSTANYQERVDAINEILNLSDMSYSIFVSTFLTNILMGNQMEALMGPLGKMEEISRLDALQDGDISNIPSLIKGLQEKIANLKKTRKQLHALLKRSQAQQVETAKSENELKTKVSQLQITNDSLQSEVDVLKVKYQVASNELLLKNNQENLNEFANQLKGAVDLKQNEAKAQTDRLEAELRQKQQECVDLTNLIKKLQTTLEESNRKQNKRFSRTESALKAQIAEMQQQLEVMESALAQKKKSAKRNERSLREQYDASLADVTRHYEESKNALVRTIEELKDKAAEARDVSKKLQQTLLDTETKNKELVEANDTIVTEKKNLVNQLNMVKAQLAKSAQHTQVQIAAQTMACENRIQQVQKEQKAACEKHVNELLSVAEDALAGFYGITDEFTEETYRTVMSHCRADLDRLQFFQNEATKY